MTTITTTVRIRVLGLDGRVKEEASLPRELRQAGAHTCVLRKGALRRVTCDNGVWTMRLADAPLATLPPAYTAAQLEQVAPRLRAQKPAAAPKAPAKPAAKPAAAPKAPAAAKVASEVAELRDMIAQLAALVQPLVAAKAKGRKAR
jgi:hypothetical protein